MAWLIAISAALLFSLHATSNAAELLRHHHQVSRRNHDRPNIPRMRYTRIVDQAGKGNFRTIQEAINSVPLFNDKWTCIRIKSGMYREQVYIPREKTYIYLRGESRLRTFIAWDGHDSLDTSATLITRANNTRARGITFVNTYNYDLLRNGARNSNPIMQAPAAFIDGDKVAFYNCRFLGLQDTLWDYQGRHYFYRCTIQGAVDFIFGAGRSIYEQCSIAVNVAALGPGFVGYITAQGRSHPAETNGFVFKYCNIYGQGQVYLGRPWRPYARVIFYKTTMSNVVVPEGWSAWLSSSPTFSEIDCQGAGANTTGRVNWANKNAAKNLQPFIDISYIDDDGWLRR